MKKIVDNLYLGDQHSTPKGTELRLCCAEELFYSDGSNNILDIFKDNQKGVFYYKFEDYSNLKDMQIETINDAISEIEKNINSKQIYVHCLWGVNRSPSIVFMYMVRNKLIGGKSYKESQNEFWKIYPKHSPNPGWKEFLIKNYPYNF
ncbi:hypothetical protein SHELI_v1c06410 [Spiroplasma helicoides]|uniref:Tyrosine specific protein phosphatases domain-containing protein n=1 Tax=Spiroplasma helicoides TaxID=216938 RepID=A0A1B3SKX9_9MOLU|nr:dual specificity protein phosphatase family protein [Spiroplasma helicoides]AOG60592.1 hypothetical protein SHELI_v1c06410 [Spiroplasma helicoides]